MSLIDKIIYLDYISTTLIDPRLLEAMLPFLKDNIANASSSYHFGQRINEKVKQARERIADFINAEPNELIYTKVATESITIAIKRVAENKSSKEKHIFTVSTEHYAVLHNCKHLETKGYEITYLSVLIDCLIELYEPKNSIREDTILVCVMYINNKIVVIQPIKDIASITHKTSSLFKTDATQPLEEIDVDAMGIDLLCLNCHNMYAPKGIGTLYIRHPMNKIKFPTFIDGDGHEKEIRSGTLNVLGVIVHAKVYEIAQTEINHISDRISAFCDKLEHELLKNEGSLVNGNRESRIFNTTIICFPNVDANVLIGRMKNIAVSNSYACTSAVVEPSHVLTEMGLSEDEAFVSIRFSLGRYNTKKRSYFSNSVN